MWQSYCDLAMAGGPPHKGRLLGPGSADEISAMPGDYLDVIEELGRGITLASELPADDSPNLGWIRVQCHSEAMAGWMLRAITMENVSTRAAGAVLELPADPHFRLEKEIKNVITVIAKTCHYWLGHIPREQQDAISELFLTMAEEAPLLEPDRSGLDTASLRRRVAARLQEQTGLASSTEPPGGWLGVQCPDVGAAVWMMRALVAHNVLSRREGSMLLVPVDATRDPSGDRLTAAVGAVRRHAAAHGIC
jgi:hypothetical protein